MRSYLMFLLLCVTMALCPAGAGAQGSAAATEGAAPSPARAEGGASRSGEAGRRTGGADRSGGAGKSERAERARVVYWVTRSSGKTHNARCRYYRNSKGYESRKGTGNDCKLCGGAGR